jgi:hypothetical protein
VKKVKTTLDPKREIEVDEAEYLDLKIQGLIASEPKTSKSGGNENPDKDKE